jgi:SAM-dependent methyltransferase
MPSIEDRYVDGSYLASNPAWDSADAAWKAQRIIEILDAAQLIPGSICDVGCGSGDVLARLRQRFPDAALTGFDISPQLSAFWDRHSNLNLRRGNFHEINTEVFDVLLMLDVFEHVPDPFAFLAQSRRHARNFVFHIPLDLSAVSVARGSPLMKVRRSVGHLHFYTKDLALETLRDCGYTIVDARYTNAASTLLTHHTLLTRLAALPRTILRALSPDLNARVLGGDTLMVLAR